mgnify:CR=1 FL=1
MQDQEINPTEPQKEKVEEQVTEPVKTKSTNISDKKDWFDIIYNSVLGFLCALLVFVAILFAIAGIVYLFDKGYERWLSSDGMVEVGECGYYYNTRRCAFYKIHPNRCILKGCKDLEFNEGDTIGVVRICENQYRYINLNTLTLLDTRHYFRADLFRNGRAMAVADDTLYVISPEGKIISSEAAGWVYSYVEEITFSDWSDREDGSYYNEIATGVYEYRDIHFHYGLMSADFKRLTPAIYSNITAESKDVFFCEYLDSGLGVLVDRNGKILK